MTGIGKALCAAALFAVTAGVSAQQPGAGGPARRTDTAPPQTADSPSTPQTLTLTGCLDRANDGTYQLLNARAASTGSSSTGSVGTTGSTNAPGGTAGTSGTTAPSATSSASEQNTWILKSTTDLAPHVGHAVEISGRLSSPNRAGAADATTSEPTTTATGARVKKPGDDARSVDVESVRMISRSCP